MYRLSHEKLTEDFARDVSRARLLSFSFDSITGSPETGRCSVNKAVLKNGQRAIAELIKI